MLRNAILGALAAVSLSSVAAYAVPVTGQISLGGYAQANGSTSMGMATGISFANASGTAVSGTSGLLSSYGGGTGAFAAVGSCGSATTGCGTIQNISSFATVGSVANFLTLNTTGAAVSFDLTSISAVTRSGLGDGGTLSFTANGNIRYAGYDTTAGTFTLTAQGNSIVSFSATTLAAGAVSVPEPVSIALLGGALATLGLVRRKSK